MDNINASSGNVPGVTTVMSNSLQGLTQVVANPVGSLPQVWYNCGPDGLGQIVTANGQPIHVELASPEMARQFNQQLQTPYGNIQVQVQPMQVSPAVEVKPELEGHVELVEEAHKPSKSRTRTAGDRVTCKTCNKTVSCNATLRDHMRTHTGERPFVCTECGFSFAQRSNLRMHKRLHTGERPYMCGICGKTFARSSHLPAHMRTHTGEKPYVCNECGHSFITAQQLKNHFRVHTGEKPWKCDLCPAAFTHSSSLSTHKKKHSGCKPYKCEKCQKCFFFTSALDKHMKVHSKERPFKCEECEKSFKYKESLTVHIDKYCGKESSKKARAPRKADALKPGPKPGSGRKYVQKRRGRPRGRPRKRGRWSQRVKTRRDYLAMEGMADPDDLEEEENNKDEPSSLKDQNEDLEGEEEEEEEMEIPTAELKVEVIQEEDSQGRITLQTAPSSSGLQQHLTAAEVLQLGNGGEIQLDGNTALTIVSAEEAEQQVAAGNVQLLTLASGMPLQLISTGDGDDVQLAQQFVTRDMNNVQVWCPRSNFDPM